MFKVVFKVVSGVLLALLLIFVFLNSKTDLSIQTPENNYVNQAMQIDFEVTKNLTSVETDDLDIEIYNIYNKDDKIEQTVSSYDTGEFSILFTPQNEGDYSINVTTSVEGQAVSSSTTFTVQSQQ